MGGGRDPVRTSFWFTVTWPRKEGLPTLGAGPVGFFLLGAPQGGPVRGLVFAAAMFPVLAAAWALHRVPKAWAEWPSPGRVGSWVKALVRYLFTDS